MDGRGCGEVNRLAESGERAIARELGRYRGNLNQKEESSVAEKRPMVWLTRRIVTGGAGSRCGGQAACGGGNRVAHLFHFRHSRQRPQTADINFRWHPTASESPKTWHATI